MSHICPEDRAYILNKYHDQEKPFDPHKRFIRREEIFDSTTGLDGDAVIAGILAQDAALADLPHPVRKAKAFAYVLENTRIACDKRDIFPAIHMIDRPLNRTVIAAWKKEIFGTVIPQVEAARLRLKANGSATINPDYDHSVPVWERIFRLGFVGLLKESQAARKEKTALTEAQSAFYDGIRITYTAILSFLSRLEQQARRQENGPLADALLHLQSAPPETFYQALLLDYLYFMLCEHVEGMQVRSLSNFDRLLFPFYDRDLKNGIPEEALRRQLAYFFLQFTAIGNYWNQPVYLGGCKADGSTQINALSYAFLEVYDCLGIYSPKIQIKVADSTPKDFLLKALDMIRRGRNSIVFVGDATIRKALEKAGVSPEAARLCDIKGCYEYSIPGEIVTEMNYVNLLKPLEYALHQGRDGLTGEQMGPESPADYESFQALFAEYKNQLGCLIDQVMQIVNGFEDHLAWINPQSMLSATCESCLAQGKDILAGGAVRNTTGMMLGFLADTADSLTNIKKYVFDSGLMTLSQLRQALDADFVGHEAVRSMLLGDRDKYGNNKPLPDGIAREISEFVCQRICGKPNAQVRGGTWNLGFHVARQSYVQGELTAASANGRAKGQELSKNLSASMGMNREGATAAILSVTKIDATAFTGDAPLDLGLLPGSVKGEEGLEAMYGLLVTFLNRGGHAMHINTFDAETLRDAQAHPEQYRDLQIRVCGWNVLWNNISPKEQEGFIRQAESLV